MIKKIFAFTVGLGLISVVGCKQASQAPASTRTEPIPFTSSSWVGSNYAATFQVCKTVTNYSDTTISSGELAIVSLWDSTSNVPVDGGTVNLNTTSLPEVNHTTDGGGINYELATAFSQSVPMAFDGSKLVWSASGSSAFPAMSDSLNFVNKEMSITSPLVGASVSKSSGFTINWTYNSGSTNTVVIQLMGDSSYSEQVVPDNGSFTITSAMIAGFSSGYDLQAIVTRITYVEGADALGRNYAMASYSRMCNFYPVTP